MFRCIEFKEKVDGTKSVASKAKLIEEIFDEALLRRDDLMYLESKGLSLLRDPNHMGLTSNIYTIFE
jgi:hypothetical protein